MGIYASVSQIYTFNEAVHSYADRVYSLSSIYEEAGDLIVKKCEESRSYLNTLFSKIGSLISEAHYAVTCNKNKVSSLKDDRNDIESKMRKQPEGADLSGYKKQIENIDRSIDSINNAIRRLEDIISKLNNNLDNIQKNLRNLDEISKNAAIAAGNAKSTIYNFNTYLGDVQKTGEAALIHVRKIDECLSSVSYTSTDDNKVIAVKNKTYLINMANSLVNVEQLMGSNSSDYARSLNAFLSVIQDEVTRGVASSSEKMLNNFAHETKDFTSYATSFKNAAVALDNYERIRR